MLRQTLAIQGIPAILWGEPSEKLYIHVHGKLSRKEHAESFARIARDQGWQTLSFDLAEHGERTDGARLDIWSGIRDLTAIADFAFGRWKRLRLYGCSLGAWFALNAYAQRPFEKCLFQSPIADMQWLVEQMMLWFSVTPEQLRTQGEIHTPIDPLRWDYYQYILRHPIREWPIPTDILFAEKDDLQSMQILQEFARRFDCRLTVAQGCTHAFMEPGDDQTVADWLKNTIS